MSYTTKVEIASYTLNDAAEFDAYYYDIMEEYRRKAEAELFAKQLEQPPRG